MATIDSDNHEKLIRISISAFTKKLDINRQLYNISINEKGAIYTVIFHTKNTSPGLRGSPAGTPDFEVSIDAKTGAFTGSQFLR